MDNYTGDGIDSVVRLSYLAPTLADPSLVVVPSTGAQSRSSAFPLTPLAIGACAAMLAGGTLALFVWHHNRRTHNNKRHVELGDNSSMAPMSLFSAERDFFEDA